MVGSWWWIDLGGRIKAKITMALFSGLYQFGDGSHAIHGCETSGGVRWGWQPSTYFWTMWVCGVWDNLRRSHREMPGWGKGGHREETTGDTAIPGSQTFVRVSFPFLGCPVWQAVSDACLIGISWGKQEGTRTLFKIGVKVIFCLLNTWNNSIAHTQPRIF